MQQFARGSTSIQMVEDVTLDMPTDLRTGHTPESFKLEPLSRRKGITRLTVEVPTSGSSKRLEPRLSPSRWKTPEFFFYGFAFCAVVPVMFWIPIRLSSGQPSLARPLLCPDILMTASHTNYHIYSERLSQGWLFGRLVVSCPLLLEQIIRLKFRLKFPLSLNGVFVDAVHFVSLHSPILYEHFRMRSLTS